VGTVGAGGAAAPALGLGAEAFVPAMTGASGTVGVTEAAPALTELCVVIGTDAGLLEHAAANHAVQAIQSLRRMNRCTERIARDDSAH
jgi:hypothetical protein